MRSRRTSPRTLCLCMCHSARPEERRELAVAQALSLCASSSLGGLLPLVRARLQPCHKPASRVSSDSRVLCAMYSACAPRAATLYVVIPNRPLLPCEGSAVASLKCGLSLPSDWPMADAALSAQRNRKISWCLSFDLLPTKFQCPLEHPTLLSAVEAKMRFDVLLLGRRAAAQLMRCRYRGFAHLDTEVEYGL